MAADTIFLMPHPCASTLYEELLHASQLRHGMYNAFAEEMGNAPALEVMEMLAALVLVENGARWRLPEMEVAENRRRFREFSSKIKRKGGIPCRLRSRLPKWRRLLALDLESWTALSSRGPSRPVRKLNSSMGAAISLSKSKVLC
ncbi:hypothetical protein [Trinickia dinghuensis]|uniref:hypothetical protein n=1 Tax=Trinickia dinghuensis TaxID=2291023 RepID=UPI0011C01A12|nr:hypothetical protein [Trinickia dinghuensis]